MGLYAMIGKDETGQGCGGPRFHPENSYRNQTGPRPKKALGTHQEKRIGGMTMQFNVEEDNLICLYHNADRRRTIGSSMPRCRIWTGTWGH